MRALDPNSEKDRRITSFTNTIYIEPWELETIRVGVYSFDCWGDMQGGLVKFTTTPAYFAQYGGMKSYLTWKLTAAGCCPPQLTKDFIMQEGAFVERDPAEEAMKMHKRGYFGGGG